MIESAAPPTPPAEKKTRPAAWLLAPLAAFAGFSLGAGFLAGHDTRATGYFDLFFEDHFHLMSWFSIAAAVLAFCQLFTAAWVFDRLPFARPRFVGAVHRWSGWTAVALALPVVYMCVFRIGFQTFDTRMAAHSVLGTLFVGAVAAKVTIVELGRLPRWALVTCGLLVFATLVGATYTSAVWFFQHAGEGF